ncbi:MAG: MarR family transcriptional regulator [Rhizobiales bacterium 65-79]|jgi:DNA-binding MarR family transcriptional regulator|nr:winged helix-turn-helix transcriptional regulator [Hyphomicrobiales bacterium]OJU03133.1 MAG: MarR family transcriptional regulator [Rhizobiales bacterium 65-79]
MSAAIDPNSFGFLITDLSRLIRAEMDRRISEAGLGLTPGESRTLAHAARAGVVRQNVLAERIGIEAMTLSTYVDRLEAKGLVERVPDPDDRRAKLVRLTEAASDALGGVNSAAASIRADASASIDPADWATLLGLLRQARDNLAEARAAQSRAREETDA